ncbi:hypothetical protein P7K49_024898, partial [Saguinus oedipus]
MEQKADELSQCQEAHQVTQIAGPAEPQANDGELDVPPAPGLEVNLLFSTQTLPASEQLVS